MERAVYLLALVLIKVFQALPLTWVARLGRLAGALAYHLDRRHRRIAQWNLQAALGSELSPAGVGALVREHFRRLGENYCSAIKTAAMTAEELKPHLEISGVETLKQALPPQSSCVVAIGHFGNFELYARIGRDFPSFTLATTYRGLKQPLLNRLLVDLRRQSGCRFFERRDELSVLRRTLVATPTLLGLLCDQHAGHSGVRIPFLGQPCATTTAPAVLALRYRLPLFTAICYRTRLACWRVEIGAEIPTLEHGRRRPVEEIMGEVNRALELAVRRDPPNWFWVHDRWKHGKHHLCRPKQS